MNQREDTRYKDKRSDCCTEQTANNRAPKRSILLTAVSCTQRHRDHANDHCESSHDNWTKARRSRFDGSPNCVAMLFDVRRCHAHAHDCAHECRYAERSMRQEEEENNTCQGCRKRCDNDERIKPAL